MNALSREKLPPRKAVRQVLYRKIIPHKLSLLHCNKNVIQSPTARCNGWFSGRQNFKPTGELQVYSISTQLFQKHKYFSFGRLLTTDWVMPVQPLWHIHNSQNHQNHGVKLPRLVHSELFSFSQCYYIIACSQFSFSSILWQLFPGKHLPLCM